MRELREAEEENKRRREREDEQKRVKAAKAAELKAKIASEIDRIRDRNVPEHMSCDQLCHFSLVHCSNMMDI